MVRRLKRGKGNRYYKLKKSKPPFFGNLMAVLAIVVLIGLFTFALQKADEVDNVYYLTEEVEEFETMETIFKESETIMSEKILTNPTNPLCTMERDLDTGEQIEVCPEGINEYDVLQDFIEDANKVLQQN